MEDNIHKIIKDGEVIIPATTSKAVLHRITGTTISDVIGEYNLTKLFPLNGEGGSDKYTLSSAINLINIKLGSEDKVPGLSIVFVESGTDKVRRFEYIGGSFESSDSWKEFGSENSGGQGGGITDAPQDDKVYGRKNGGWAEIVGSGTVTIDSELSLTSTNPVQNRVISAKLEELDNIVNPLTLSVSGGGLFEKGTTQRITISWVLKKGSSIVTPDSSTVNDEPVSGTSKNYDGVVSTTTYTVKSLKGSKTVKASTTATFIAPMYFGFSENSTASGLIIDSLQKQSLKTTPGGSYTINNPTSGNYLWLCVPEEMSINRVTSGGFDVPMESSQEGSTSVGVYKCYRSSSSINQGNMNIIIS